MCDSVLSGLESPTKASVCVFLDFDDTLVPSTSLSKFFSGTAFSLPPPVMDQLVRLDRLVCTFIDRHMARARFRILTGANDHWVRKVLDMVPGLRRRVEWNYVQLVFCNNQTKQTVVHSLVSRERPFDQYMSFGDTAEDVACIANVTRPVRTLKFVRRPTIDDLLFQWSCMESTFAALAASTEQSVQNMFVVPTSQTGQPGSGRWNGRNRALHTIFERNDADQNKGS